MWTTNERTISGQHSYGSELGDLHQQHLVAALNCLLKQSGQDVFNPQVSNFQEYSLVGLLSHVETPPTFWSTSEQGLRLKEIALFREKPSQTLGLEIRFVTALEERFVNSDVSGTLQFDLIGQGAGRQ